MSLLIENLHLLMYGHFKLFMNSTDLTPLLLNCC